MVAIALSGCQLLAPTGEVQCSADPDCVARGDDFAGSVCVDNLCVAKGDRCLDHVAEVVEVVEDRTKPLHERLRFVNIGGTPVAGVQVLVCAIHDETCESPVGAPLVTDSQGYVYATLWKNFRGTIQVKNPPMGSDIMKLKIHFVGRLETEDKSDRVIPPEGAVHLLTRDTPRAAARLASQARSDGGLHPGGDRRLRHRSEGRRTGHGLASRGQQHVVPVLLRRRRHRVGDRHGDREDGLFGIVNVPEGPVVLDGTITSSGKKLRPRRDLGEQGHDLEPRPRPIPASPWLTHSS